MSSDYFLKFIKNYPDFPAKGVVFRDISPLLADPDAFARAIDALEENAKAMPAFDKIVAIDARGFIFGSVLALRLKKGLVLCRKKSKLPGELVSQNYGYEYAKSSLSNQKTAIKNGE